MSPLYLFIFLIVSYGFVKNFKWTLILYAPFKLIFHSGIFLVDSSISVNLDLAVTSVALLLYGLRPKYNYKSSRIPTILALGWIVYMTTLLIHAVSPALKPTLFLQEGVTTFGYCYMLFKCVRRRRELKMLVKGFVIVSLILFVDGIIDVITDVNLIAIIEESQAGARFWHSGNDLSRAGVSRTTSFMPHALTMGCLAALLWGLLYLLIVKDGVRINKKLFYTSLAGLALCVVFSNSRSSLIAFIVLLPILLDYKSMTTTRMIMFSIGAMVLLFAFANYFIWMYDSVVHENKMNVQGSTSDLREIQFNVALFWMMKNPLFGMGNTFQVLNYEDQNEIMGMESVWFPIMMQQGIVGLLGYATLLITTILFFLKMKMPMHLFFIAAWIVVITLSSQIGLSLYLLVLLPLLAYKEKILSLK